MVNEIAPEDIELMLEFVQESRDMIADLEPTIIELGQTAQDGEVDGDTINAIFRLFHSMKGSAGFLDLKQVARVAHSAENLLDIIRSGKARMEPDYIDLLCQSCDFSNAALEYVEQHYNDEGVSVEAETMAAKLGQAVEKAKAGGGPAAPPAEAVDTPAENQPEKGILEDIPVAEELPPVLEEVLAAPEPEPAVPAGQKAGAGSAPFSDEEDMPITKEMVDAFVQEGDELLQQLEEGLLQWEKNMDDQELVKDLFRSVHSFKGNCGFFGFADLERLSHLMENILDAAKSGIDLSHTPAATELLDMVDVLRNGVVSLSQSGNGAIDNLESCTVRLDDLLVQIGKAEATDGDRPHVGEILVQKGAATAVAVDVALQTQKKPVGELLVAMGETTTEQVVDAVQEQERIKEERARKKLAAPLKAPMKKAAPPAAKGGVNRQDIRVDLKKMDILINLIGEMVIAENMLIHNPDLEGLELENFTKAAQHMGKIIRDLQEMAMIIRMIPVSGLFRRMIRLVHDISIKAGKKVELKLIGEETELDKTVIETISDPLVHLLRNSMDHGLEPPEERLAAGKSEKGEIRLAASHEEGEIWIVVEDDGRGLNRERILEKARAKGLIAEDQTLSDREIYNLIFQAGFSTAQQITDISGRGVGMDVVKQNLDKIRGKVDVDSTPGKGSKITLRIPLTLAIIEGMLIRIGRIKCILPLLAIREIFKPDMNSMTYTPDGQEIVKVRDKFYPVVRIHEVLRNTPDSKALNEGILILIEYQGTGVCCFADEILGQQQTVIKALTSDFGNIHYFSGCTILGNGDVCLIFDIGALVEEGRNKKMPVTGTEG